MGEHGRGLGFRRGEKSARVIISRNPYRISLVGGSTDYKEWFKDHPGACLSTTINRYAYLSVRRLPPFHPHKTRAVWSEIENVSANSEIRHPAIRGCLEFMGVEEGLEIHHDGDLPGRSGMGSSAVFTVGLLHCLHALKSEMVSKRTLALEAMQVDQDIVSEVVGCQDHCASAFGGLNRMDFGGERADFTVTPIPLGKERLKEFERHLMLFFTGISRHASEVAARQVAKIGENGATLERMAVMVAEGQELLMAGQFREFGLLIEDAWKLKRSLGASNGEVDSIHDAAMKAGALGTKILGAGEGGFMLVVAESDRHTEIRAALGDLLYVPFEFERQGSQIVYYSGE